MGRGSSKIGGSSEISKRGGGSPHLRIKIMLIY